MMDGGFGSFFIVHEGPQGQGIFHPKTYAFSNDTHVAFATGSGNLTEGGLFVNHEATVVTTFARGGANSALEAQFDEALSAWLTHSAWCLEVTPSLIGDLHNRGDLPSEAAQRILNRAAAGARRAGAGGAGGVNPFGASPKLPRPAASALPSGLPPAPITPVPSATAITVTSTTPPPPIAPAPVSPNASQFFIEVRPHHNGEIFLSYNAIADNPAFFGHPFPGWTTPKQAHNAPYPQLDPDPVVEIIIYDTAGQVVRHKATHPLNVVDYKPKHEIRVTVPDGLHAYIPTMSTLAMTKDPAPGLDYRLEFYPPSAVPANIAARLTNSLPSGGQPVARRYGW